MASIMETGFVSEKQEYALRINNPSLYKAVLKKHGSFSKPKAVQSKSQGTKKDETIRKPIR